ncbi:MAG: vWA domain-containing protein [Candidatus Woesearchaeota archaeon]
MLDLYNPFENLMLLVLLLVFTTLAFYSFTFLRKKRASRFGNIKTLERVHGFKRFHISPGILIIKLFVVSLLFLVATDSVQVSRFQPTADTDYVLLLDTSPSMTQTDLNPSRLGAAKNIATDWLRVVPNGTRVGLVSYSRELGSTVDPTFNKEHIRSEIARVEVDLNQTDTSPDFAIQYATNMLNDSTNKRAVLLFTDGTQPVDPSTIRLAQNLNVRIYAFGIGTEETREFDLSDIPEELWDTFDRLEFNFSRLQSLSEATNGTAYHIGSQDDLRQAFRDATYEEAAIQLNSAFYVLILIALISILELFVYAHLGGI